MSDWLLRIVAIIIATTCAEMLLPEGKIKSTCKISLSLLCVLVFAEPLGSIKNLNIEENFLEQSSIQTNVEINTSEYFCSFTEKELVNYLNERKIKVNNCTVNGLFTNGEFLIDKIIINLHDTVISEKDEHIIFIEEIKNTVTEVINISKEKVFVYGK